MKVEIILGVLLCGAFVAEGFPRNIQSRQEFEFGNDNSYFPSPNGRTFGNIAESPTPNSGEPSAILLPPTQEFTGFTNDHGGRWIPPARRENENSGSGNQETLISPPNERPRNIVQPPRRENGNDDYWFPPPGGRPIGNIVQPPRRENEKDDFWVPPPGGRPIGNIVQPPRRENGNDDFWVPPPGGRPIGNIVQPPRREKRDAGTIIQPVY